METEKSQRQKKQNLEGDVMETKVAENFKKGGCSVNR
jgi:hypothetical protein